MARVSGLRHAFAAAVAFVSIGACAATKSPPLTAENCAVIGLWSNGFHTNIAIAADALAADHPVRQAFPDARYFLIGWGERDFYMHDDSGFWRGLKAITPPSPSVIQVIAGQTPPESDVWPGDVVTAAITLEGRDALAEGLARAFETDKDGAPIPLGPGRVEGASDFFAARGQFHLFNMCNHWTARRLREAGIPLHASISFTAPGLMRAVRDKTERHCPPRKPAS